MELTKKNFSSNIISKKLIQENKNQSKDIEFIKKFLLHLRENLERKKRIKQEPEIQYVKTVPQHARDLLKRKLKNKPANIIWEEEFPYFNREIKVKETDKIKDERQLHIKSLNRDHQTMINSMLNTIEILIHIILERKMKKNCYYRQ